MKRKSKAELERSVMAILLDEDTKAGETDHDAHITLSINDLVPYVPLAVPAKKERGELIMPDRAPNMKRVYWYLCTARGIEPEIVSRLMNEKKYINRPTVETACLSATMKTKPPNTAPSAVLPPTSRRRAIRITPTRVILFLWRGLLTGFMCWNHPST